MEAAICCLDSLNYLTDAREVRETFRRLHLFIAPGGSLVFDVHALGKLEAMDGQVWLDEREDVYCVWRTEYSRRSRLLDYYVDIFSVRADGAWERSFEEQMLAFLRSLKRYYNISEYIVMHDELRRIYSNVACNFKRFFCNFPGT